MNIIFTVTILYSYLYMNTDNFQLSIYKTIIFELNIIDDILNEHTKKNIADVVHVKKNLIDTLTYLYTISNNLYPI